MFDFSGYTVFTCISKMGVGSSREGVQNRLKTLPLLVTYERWHGGVFRCDVIRLVDGFEVTIDIDDANREIRCSSRHRGAIESMLADMGVDVGDRGHVEETQIRLHGRA